MWQTLPSIPYYKAKPLNGALRGPYSEKAEIKQHDQQLKSQHLYLVLNMSK